MALRLTGRDARIGLDLHRGMLNAQRVMQALMHSAQSRLGFGLGDKPHMQGHHRLGAVE